ncbi:chorismate synthase [Enterobacter cancerogenus]|uniref:chorismate synthase n=1 Tax=Enterobacter cancerogenus TaxID=69218 RepID=A0A484Z7Y3_9ENTR|nr:chorismate synthase [Enterobacter cancerogenus]
MIRGCLSQMGDIPLAINDWALVEQNPFFCADADKLDALDELMRGLKKEGDSIGAKVTVVADGVPPGWGEPVFDRLDADIAHALMSINAVKGVESATVLMWFSCAVARIATKSPHRAFRATMRGHSRRDQQRPADCRQHCAETNLEHYGARPYD